MKALKWPLMLALLLLAPVLFTGCATIDDIEADIPAGADESTRTESNGDVITEYRVAGQLHTVRVQPARGPVYYLNDTNGDGRLDKSKGEVSPVYYKLFEWN
jgi:Protein of unknown function (DUF2782)